MEEITGLVVRAAAKDGIRDDRLKAFGELVQHFQDMAFGYAYSILGDFHLAEDAAQEAFVTAYQQLGKLRDPGAFAGWLRQIVRTACNRLLRHTEAATTVLDTAGSVAAKEFGPAHQVEKIEMCHEVLAAIQSLSEPERTATTLFYINGYSQKDIAAFLEVPVPTVNNRLRTSRKRLKERMITMVEETLHKSAPGEQFRQKVLDRIVRFPVRVMRQDENGHVFAEPMAHPSARSEPKLLGCLYCAIRMCGHEVPYEQITMATGEAFRFTFEENWCFEAEHISPVDALNNFCAILGFEYTDYSNQKLGQCLELIERNLIAGTPVLIGVGRCWRLIVGFDKAEGLYHYIGGDWEVYEVPVGEKLSEFLRPDECHTMPIPTCDWYSCIVGPDQFARNPVFVLGKRQPLPVRETIRRSIELAIDVALPRKIERARVDMKQRAKPILDPNEAAHFWSFEPGQFDSGTDAIRVWARAIEQMPTPTHDFKWIHANDTTLGCQLERIQEAANWLSWASNHCGDNAQVHIEAALDACRQAAEGGDHQVPALRRWTCPTHNPAELQQEIRKNPSLVYLVDADKQEWLGDLSERSQRCPWGISIIPDQQTFEVAKRQAVDDLTRIADLRAKAIVELKEALKRMQLD